MAQVRPRTTEAHKRVQMIQPPYQQISAAIEGTAIALKLEPFKVQEARNAVSATLDTYWEDDQRSLHVFAVEERIDWPAPGVPLWRVSGQPDMVAALRDTNEIVIRDWKTTSSKEFDHKWEGRYRTSWQWRIYSRFLNASYFQYCGIHHSGVQHRFTVAPGPENGERVDRFIQSTLRHLELEWGAPGPWPMVTTSCNAYGRPCPHYKACHEDCLTLINPPEGRHIRVSSLSDYWLCPERFRMNRLYGELGAEEEPRPDADFGTVVHAGLATAYRALLI